MIVFVVGAGATLAEALPGHPRQAEKPPLDASFFSLCERAKLEGAFTLRRYLDSNYGINPFAGEARMEEVFNIVYADTFSDSSSADGIDAYWALLKMYHSAIRLTTNPLTGTSRAGVGALLRFFARRGEEDFVFVTFNQDLLIEKAIDAAKRTSRYSHLSWDIWSAYRIKFAKDAHLPRGVRKPFHAQLPTPTRSIGVLKLHGSMNWVYPVRSAEDAKNALRSPSRDLTLLNEQRILSKMVDRSGKRAKPSLPFVVPPIYGKSSLIRDVLQPVWKQARDAVQEADELIIFGYSCPDADQDARNMISNAFHRNTKTDHVHIIDPSPAASGRVGSLLRAPVVTRYATAGAFIDHYQSA